MRYVKTFVAPDAGEFPLTDPRRIPPNGAARLRNLRVDDSRARSTDGFATFTSAPSGNANPIIDGFNLQFFDSSVESFLCYLSGGTSGATSAIQSIINNAASGVTLDNTFGGGLTDRFSAAVVKWASEAKGRIILTNGNKIKSWKGTGNTMSDLSGGYPCRYLLVGPDNRLFMGFTKESSDFFSSRVRWSIAGGLLNGSSSDFTAAGSGVLDLTYDQWQMTAMWNQLGRIFVGKERSIAAMSATGIATDAYGYEVVNRNRGVFAPGSLIQHGDIAAFISHIDFEIFDGVNLQGVGGPKRRELFKRLNYAALRQITRYLDGPNKRVGWGLPLDGSNFPSEIWWLHLDTGAWEVQAPFSHTTLFEYTNVDVTYVDELVGFVNAQVGTVDSLSPLVSSKGALVIGFYGGTTWKQTTDPTQSSILQICEYVSPAIKPIGETIILENGQQHVISDRDYLVLDEVKVVFDDYGQTYNVQVFYSLDNGLSFTPITTASAATITTAGGTDNAPRQVERYFNTRAGIGQQVQIKLRCAPLRARWGFSEMQVKLHVAGVIKK